jgi:hypothetical protein
MKLFFSFLLVFSLLGVAQSNAYKPVGSKGEHYALYNKCKTAVTFCELTQQNYTSCGSIKNCYGLYVMPGDTFYINIEDKLQAEIISADISFGGYFPSINSFTFEPVDANCMATQALQIAIPLTAVAGSSFQIVAQNTDYVNSSLTPGTPLPFPIYVGGLQPQFTFALSDFTICPITEDVSVKEFESENRSPFLYPNPTEGFVSVLNIGSKNYNLEIYNFLGHKISELKETNTINISSLNNGIYFCKIIVDDKCLATEKIVLMK